MRRVYYPHHVREEFAGMWRAPNKADLDAKLQQAIDFTGDAEQYGAAMRRAVVEWPISAEHNLTDPSMNRLAWIGHAACFIAIGCPEWITRRAWAMLTEEQRIKADAKAQDTLDGWLRNYSPKGRCVPEKLAQARLF